MWKCKLFEKIYWRMYYGYSPVILFTGSPNTGKTCLATLFAEYLYWKFTRKDWSVKDHCVFDMDQMSHKFLNLYKTPIVVAEAGFDLDIDDWRSPANRFFSKIVTTQRTTGNCYLLNIPNAKDLAAKHRRKVDWLIDVKRHKVAKVYKVVVARRRISGNEFGLPFYWTLVGYPVPKCFKELKKLDEDNKSRIKDELIEDYKNRTEKIKHLKKIKHRKFKCHCGYEWFPKKDMPRQCPGCKKRLLVKDGVLDVEISEE